MQYLETISVIMPCYNAAGTLARSVASALGQTYKNIELIIVDDGSTDASRTVLRNLQAEDPRVRVILQENRGAGPARNHGIRRAGGDFIAFLDADDTWAPDCLEKLHAGLMAAPEAALAYCGWQNLGLAPEKCQPYVPPDYEAGDKAASFLETCPWPIHAALIRREAMLEIGGFDERWSSCMDFDLWLRMGVRYRITRVPEVLAYYWHEAGREQITRNRARVALNHWRIQLQFLEQHPEIAAKLGRARIRRLTDGELMERGFLAYWRRDLSTARTIFRQVMRRGYGRLRDWAYMLPCLLPEKWHLKLIHTLER
jgi:glycosyltransferase involved in cell wall biosynthesis